MRRTLALVMMAMLTTLIAKADDPGNHRLSLAHKTEVTIAGMKLKRFDSDFAEDGHAVTFETFSGPNRIGRKPARNR